MLLCSIQDTPSDGHPSGGYQLIVEVDTNDMYFHLKVLESTFFDPMRIAAWSLNI